MIRSAGPTLPAGVGAALFLLATVAWAVPGLPVSLALVQQFAHSSGPYHDVRITDADADAYWAGAGSSRLPAGVTALRMHALNSAIEGRATIDFNALQASANPLLSLFSGTHTVTALAHVDSALAPRAQLTITQVQLDGHVIPPFLVDAAIDAWVRVGHPGLGRTFSVPLPKHAISARAEPGFVLIHYPSR